MRPAARCHAGQALIDYLLMVALVSSVVAFIVAAVVPLIVRLVVVVTNHVAVYLSSAS